MLSASLAAFFFFFIGLPGHTLFGEESIVGAPDRYMGAVLFGLVALLGFALAWIIKPKR
jgi:hypothetical protein